MNTENREKDIIEKLEQTKRNPSLVSGSDIENVVNDAIIIIQELRNALRMIGYDYVELSHDKVQWLYHEHMKDARKALENSYPPLKEKTLLPLDDNF